MDGDLKYVEHETVVCGYATCLEDVGVGLGAIGALLIERGHNLTGVWCHWTRGWWYIMVVEAMRLFLTVASIGDFLVAAASVRWWSMGKHIYIGYKYKATWIFDWYCCHIHIYVHRFLRRKMFLDKTFRDLSESIFTDFSRPFSYVSGMKSWEGSCT